MLHFRCMKQKYHFCLSFLYSWTSLCIFCWNIFVNTWWWCIYWSKWKLISFRSNFCVLYFPYTARVKFFLYVSKCWYWEVRSVSPESISFGDMFHVIYFQMQSQLKDHLWSLLFCYAVLSWPCKKLSREHRVGSNC